MGTTTKTLYDTDFVEWAEETAKQLREGRFGEVDLEHLIEEVEDLAGSQRAAVVHQLERMLLHLLKQRLQPERAGSSWRRSINSSRSSIQSKIDLSPSLARYLEGSLPRAYRRAVKAAIYEMQLPRSRAGEMPAECPWTIEELLEGDPR